MLRPVLKYAKSPEWPHGFATHDVGTYPIIWGQTYVGTIKDVQMPIDSRETYTKYENSLRQRKIKGLKF